MKITVVLCTHNRCRQLAKALESIANLRLPELVEWEVLVVDNNSRDETRQVVEDFIRRYPGRFRYLFEVQQGKSHALNAGIRSTSGDIVAFTDDDVSVDPAWLQNLTAALHADEWAGAGGRILPESTFVPPKWLSVEAKYAAGPLVIFDRGDEPGDLKEAPFGANMAFRRKVFELFGEFRTDLGPCPGTEIRGEDSEFVNRLLSSGERMRYEPDAIVYHPVPEGRLRQEYFLAWWYDKARSQVRTSNASAGAKWTICGMPIYSICRLGFWTLRWIVTFDSARRFLCKINVWIQLGAMAESYHRAQAGKDRKGLARL